LTRIEFGNYRHLARPNGNRRKPTYRQIEQIDERVFPSLQEQEDYAGKEIPVGYIGEAEDVALMAVFLCSPRARYITG
jgi:NAD(P)-dependent dehydrogenase (short-subunit alcohol dehydrogenase family)